MTYLLKYLVPTIKLEIMRSGLCEVTNTKRIYYMFTKQNYADTFSRHVEGVSAK